MNHGAYYFYSDPYSKDSGEYAQGYTDEAKNKPFKVNYFSYLICSCTYTGQHSKLLFPLADGYGKGIIYHRYRAYYNQNNNNEAKAGEHTVVIFI